MAGSVDRWIGGSVDREIVSSVGLWICRSLDR